MMAGGPIWLRGLVADPLRTALSTLGVVVGVAALVAVLALSDGVERFSRAELARTTDLEAVVLRPLMERTVDGVRVRVDHPVRFGPDEAAALRTRLPPGATVLRTMAAGVVAGEGGAQHGLTVTGVDPADWASGPDTLVQGRRLTPCDNAASARAAVLNASAAEALAAHVGDTVRLGAAGLAVVGVTRAGAGLQVVVPLATFTALGLATDRLPILVLRAARLEDVPAVRDAAEEWLASWIGAAWPDAVQLQVNARRVAQAMQAMRVFRLLMGAITGVTLLVGGIGIMNIMLASVLERTREIGVRRAAGARRRDILLQFVAEAVAVTLAGGLLGIAVGFALATVAGAVMRSLTDAPIHIAFAWRTPAAALGAAAAVGVAFGLYPAQRAARLAPADALRHE
jgi:putative ABC transport system permease protein